MHMENQQRPSTYFEEKEFQLSSYRYAWSLSYSENAKFYAFVIESIELMVSVIASLYFESSITFERTLLSTLPLEVKK